MRLHALLAAVIAFLAACAVPLAPPPAGPSDDNLPPRRGGILRLAAGEDVHTLDPALGYDVVSWSFEQMLFNTLVRYGDGTTIVADLADTWDQADDGLRFRFRLRPSIRFGSGRACDATDVQYSLERLLKPTLHSPGAGFFEDILGAREYTAGTAEHIRGIEASGDVVEITLNRPDPLFLHKLAMPFAAIVDREAVERVGDAAFARHPMGTGPFILQDWVAWQRLRLTRNPFYFRDPFPHLDGVELTIGLSDQLAWFKYQRGELDITGIPSAEFARVIADARYRPVVLERTTLRTQYLGLNCDLPPFTDPNVRRGVNLAVNRERILELLDGRGVIARTILPPDMPGYDISLAGYTYDPAGARQRLAASGVGGRLSTTLWATRDDGALRIAQSIQQDLAAVGIAMAIKPVDFPALIEAIRHPRQVPIFLLGWEADFPDPSNFLTVLLHSRSRDTNNNTFYANPKVDRLLDTAESVASPDRRLALFHVAETRILRDAPWVPLIHPVSYVVRHPRVRNYRLHPLRPTQLETVSLAW